MTRARDLADYVATGVTSSEFDILDGLTATVSELNIMDGVTATAAELNIMDGVTATTTELNYVDGVTSSIQTQMNNLAGSATIAVTVVDSGGNKYALDGTVQQLALLTPSVTYRFDQSDSSNSGHPLLLSTTSGGTHGGGSAFTTGVTAVGTPGSAGAYTEVKLEQDAPDTLYYYCTNHSGMGGEIDVRATVSSLSDLSVTATASELNIMDGVTATTAELNIMDGVTSTAAELNILDGVTASATDLNLIDGITNGTVIASKAIITDSNKDITGLRNVTATGAITGGSFVIGSADINENDLESIDGITAGTIAASKAAVVDANKDVTGFRNITLTGELDAGSLDISGDADIDGTLETDALSINGTAVTSTAAELNILDGVTSTAAELNALDGITAVVGELNALDIGSTAVGTAVASKAVILDSNKDYTGIRNLTITGELDAATLDVSGNVDIDGTLETDNLTIGGSQGSDGQVLTSTGSGVAFETINIPAGGSQDFVASGSISDGNIVGLKSDGTVSVVEAVVGSVTEFTDQDVQDCHAVFDSNSNKIVVVYQDTTASNVGKAVVGTVSGTGISFGTPAAFSGSDGTSMLAATFDSNSNKVVIAYQNTGGDSSHGYAIVGTVSGTSISFGTAVEFENASVARNSICFVPDGNRVVIGYRDQGDSNKGKAIVGTVSGTGISFGSAAEFESGGILYTSVIYDTNADRIVAAYRDQGDSNVGKAVVGTISGTSISFGTPVTFHSSIITNVSMTFDSNSNKVVIGFKDSNTGSLGGVATPEGAGFAIVGTVSGTSISFGTRALVGTSTTVVGDLAIGFDSNVNKIVVCFSDTNGGTIGKFQTGIVSGTGISFSGSVIFNSDQCAQFGTQGTQLAFDSNSNRMVIPFRHDSDSNLGKAVVINSGSTLPSWIGFADGAISNGATGAINIVGGINDAQSSLTIGTKLYLQNDGTLSATFVEGREVGRAISATKIFVTKGSLG